MTERNIMIKPSNNGLRKQIIHAFYLMWMFMVLSIVLSIFSIGLSIICVLGALICFVSQKLDKIRLEVREWK